MIAKFAEWGRTDVPAPTIAGDPRLPRRAYRKGNERQMDGAARLTEAEALALQGYPAGFTLAGNQGSRFLQVGNSVPPPLAAAVLSELWGGGLND